MEDLTPQQLYDQSYKLYKARKFDACLQSCEKLLIEFPDSEAAEYALLNFPIIWNKESQTITLKPGYKTLSRRSKIIVTVIFAVILAPFFTIYMPGFKGRLLDLKSGEPVADAYVVTFEAHTHYMENFQYGTPGSYPVSIDVEKTDENGYFRVGAFFKFSGGTMNTRQIYIFKKGYIYAKKYYQGASDRWIITKRRSKNLSGEKKYTYRKYDFYLSNEEDLYLNGSNSNANKKPIINPFYSLLSHTKDYRGHFKSKKMDDAEESIFLEIYEVLSYHSHDIKKTFHRRDLRHNWDVELAYYSDDLGVTVNKGWKTSRGKMVNISGTKTEKKSYILPNTDIHLNYIKFQLKESSASSSYKTVYSAFDKSRAIAETENEIKFVKESFCERLNILHDELIARGLVDRRRYNVGYFNDQRGRINDHEKLVLQYCEKT